MNNIFLPHSFVFFQSFLFCFVICFCFVSFLRHEIFKNHNWPSLHCIKKMKEDTVWTTSWSVTETSENIICLRSDRWTGQKYFKAAILLYLAIFYQLSYTACALQKQSSISCPNQVAHCMNTTRSFRVFFHLLN